MDIGRWRSPVIVMAGKDFIPYRVTNAARAAEILLEHWPAEPGPKHLAARKVMLDCLSGKCDPEAAREAFVQAGAEARNLVGGG